MNKQMSMQPLRLRCNSNTHGSRWDIGMTARIASGNRGGLDGGSQETKVLRTVYKKGQSSRLKRKLQPM